MPDDQLRMQAIVVDKATGPLKDIQRGLRDVSKSANFSALRGEFEGLRRATELVSREIRTVMVPAFSEWIGLSIKEAVATSLACVGILAASVCVVDGQTISAEADITAGYSGEGPQAVSGKVDGRFCGRVRQTAGLAGTIR